jgi:hypothetical protein
VVLLAERGKRSAAEDFEVLDYGDIGSGALFRSRPRPVAQSPESRGNSPSARPVAPVPSGLTASADSTGKVILVPVAGDGSTFGPDLARSGRYTVGAKGAEVQYDDFAAALAALHRMDTPHWRRPNAAGNWGIAVSRLHELLPWNWQKKQAPRSAEAA